MPNKKKRVKKSSPSFEKVLKKDFNKIEKSIEKDVKGVERWVVERRKFFNKLIWVIALIAGLLIFCNLIMIFVGAK